MVCMTRADKNVTNVGSQQGGWQQGKARWQVQHHTCVHCAVRHAPLAFADALYVSSHLRNIPLSNRSMEPREKGGCC